MITLKQRALSDTAIGSITVDECKLMSNALEHLSTSWMSFFLPKHLKKKKLAMSMLAATLSRTPTEMQPIQNSIMLAMEKGMGDK